MDDIVLISITEDRLKTIIADTVFQTIRKINSEEDPLKDYPNALTRTQVSKILGIALNTVDAWSRGLEPKLEKVFIDNAARFRKSDIQKLLKGK